MDNWLESNHVLLEGDVRAINQLEKDLNTEFTYINLNSEYQAFIVKKSRDLVVELVQNEYRIDPLFTRNWNDTTILRFKRKEKMWKDDLITIEAMPIPKNNIIRCLRSILSGLEPCLVSQ
jgi:hypothetical protein